MRALAAMALFVAMCAASASAQIVPSGHNMMWEDYYGDWHDNYIEVERGQSFALSIRVNYSGGGANGGITNVSWDSAVVDVTEDPSNTYWRQYYTLQFEAYWDGGFETQWYEDYWNPDVYAIGEGQYVNRVWVTVEPDAPLGISLLGLTQTMLYQMSAETNAVIPRDGTDPFAMQINVVSSDPPPPGDYDEDYDVDADDIDILANAIEGGSTDLTYDVNGDSVIDEADMIEHVATLAEWSNDADSGVGTYRADFNLDGYVNGTDLAILKAGFGLSGLGYAAGNCNADDFVNGTDLAVLKATFGFSGTPGGGNPPAVPEPATMCLLAMGGMALLRRRK